MSLSAADVAEIMRLVEQSTFDELTLEIDGVKLTLRRGAAVQQSTTHTEAAAPSAALASAGQSTGHNSAATRTGASRGSEPGRSPSPPDANVHEVQSPLLGTFYRSPKPGAPPFVDVGSVVEEDTTVAIIEVMKLMNTVRAGVRGTVAEVLASDGALVEFEQPLLRVRKAG